MKKNFRSLDFLLYISSFISLILIVLLLTSSKSISYDIENTVIKEEGEVALNIDAFTIEETEYKEGISTEKEEKAIINETDQKRINAEPSTEKPEPYHEVQKGIPEKTMQTKFGRIKPIEKITKKKSIQYHTVKRGDSLWKISIKYNIDIDTILRSNKIKDPDLIYEGQRIKILSNEYSENPAAKNNNIKIQAPVTKTTRTITREKRKFKFIWPLKGRISSEFGVRRSPYNKKMEFHPGIDIANKLGKNIMAAENGKVIFSGIKGGYGKKILIQHRKSYKTCYGHVLISYVKAGQYVEKGQVIGRLGNTGLSTGPHLHFEIRRNNVAIDPTSLINKRLLFY